jgi:uncharacterized protein YjbI with pentapeptide repeats
MHEPLHTNNSKLKSDEAVSQSVDKIDVNKGQCIFEAKYNNLQATKEEKFERWMCLEATDTNSSFCVFHNKSRIQWEDKDYQKFRDKVLKIISDPKRGINTPLYCIGYHFPMNINFKHLAGLNPNDRYEFDFPIYFSEADFEGQVDFSRCTFKSTFSLAGATFKKDVLFRKTYFSGKFYPRNTKFNGNVNFRWANFNNADFHDTLFSDKANFHDSVFEGDKTRFLDVIFEGRANFEKTHFNCKIGFDGTTFNHAKFSDVEFKDIAKFRKVIFENGEKVNFDVLKLENVSFLNTDITRVKFAENTNWGGSDKFTVIEEREPHERFLFTWDKVPESDEHLRGLMNFLKSHFGLIHYKGIVKANYATININNIQQKNDKNSYVDEVELKNNQIMHKLRIKVNNERTEATLKIDGKICYDFCVKVQGGETKIYSSEYPSLDSIKSIYRNLRENYEYRLRYDEAGKFFIREMELKRLYRTLNTLFTNGEFEDNVTQLRRNNWFRRNLFSLTGWYYHLALYGESLIRPMLAGVAIVLLSTLFWLIQINPSAEPSFTNTVGLANATNFTVLQKAFERSMTDFLPLLSSPSEVRPGLIDFVIKIIGGAVTFGLIAIALRRKFERRFRH